MTCETRITYREPGNAPFSLLREMYVERGTEADWEELHALHYKAEGRLIGPTYYRCVMGSQLIGVVALSAPKLLLAPRHQMFPKLMPGHDTKITNTYRAVFINKNFIVNSRTVVDTLYRAVGVSYRMLNLASRMHGKRYVEIQSSMSRFNPFAMRAGFKFVKPKEGRVYEKGLIFMKKHFSTHPADHQGVLEELQAMPPAIRARTLEAMQKFYFKHSPMEKTGGNLNSTTNFERVKGYSESFLIKQLQQLIFAMPMYGVYQNPDAGRKLPSRIPLLAFDRQPPNEPLKLD